MMRATVVWFTGLSGSGKTTIASAIEKKLSKAHKKVLVLDGDMIRSTFHKNLTFSPGDIKINNRRVAAFCKKHAGTCDYILVTLISPFRECRAYARKIFEPRFIEVFIKASMPECQKRDVKGLYKKALAGKIDNFIGLSPATPYEKPLRPEIVIDTVKNGLDSCVDRLFAYLDVKNKNGN
jgi:adenylylsulfate kinase